MLTESTFISKMNEKDEILQQIANHIKPLPYIYMTVDEYLEITPRTDKLYWVINDVGIHGVYKNRRLVEGMDVSKPYSVIQSMVRNGTFANFYSVGDQLKVKYNGNDTLWDIVAIDVATPADTSKTHSVTLMSHCLLPDFMMFDNKEPNNSDYYRLKYGNNRYKDSNIRQWLNSDGAAGSWWTAQHDTDAAPSYATAKAGFMNGFDADFLDVIGETKIKVVKNTVTDGGGYEELTDTFYLPSKMEVGLGAENSIEEGVQFPYFTDNASRIKYREGTSSAYYWWLRTPISSNSYVAQYVNTGGSLNNGHQAYLDDGVVPTCNII